MNKRDAQIVHSLRRAKERYDVDLTPLDLIQIKNKIKKGKSLFVNAKTLRVTIHSVEHKGVSYIVAYDKYRGSVCSFLPKREARKEAHKQKQNRSTINA